MIVPLWPSGLVTTTFTEPAVCAGVVTVRLVLLTKLTPIAAVPPKLTVAPDTKLVPVMVTDVPPAFGPFAGAMPPTVGAGPVACALKVAICMAQAPEEVSVAVAL